MSEIENPDVARVFEGKRAIVFRESDELPVEQLKHCVSLALTYHRVKHLPLLGG